MGIKEEALRRHACGLNCAQSVLSACGKYTGLDEKTARAISGGFGGGVRCGEICGALSGAVMAIGMAKPYSNPEDINAKNKIAMCTKQCCAQFQKEFGCVRCLDLKKAGHSCDTLIAYAAQLAEDIIFED